MLGLFRNNQFTTAIPLALYVGLTHFAALFGHVQAPLAQDVVENGVLYRAWFGWTGAGPFWLAVSAAVLVWVQALLVNYLADAFRLLGDRNWLPGMFYALAASCLPEFLFLSAPLMAATFVPLVLGRIFKAYQRPQATGLIFDAAFWTAAGSFFYPPMIFLLASAYAGLMVVRSFNFREQMVLLTGVLTAVFLAWLWYFWTDRGGEFWQIQFGALYGTYAFDFKFDMQMTLRSALLGVIFLTVLLSYGTYFFRKLIQTQKNISVLYWFLFVGGLTILLQPDPRATHLMLLMPSVGIFLALSFSALRSRLIAEIFHLALLGFVLFIQFTGWVE